MSCEYLIGIFLFPVIWVATSWLVWKEVEKPHPPGFMNILFGCGAGLMGAVAWPAFILIIPIVSLAALGWGITKTRMFTHIVQHKARP